jgi:3,4-dihydroxy 2-butanone 4-phosphate synthase/GTP cyclohydrolase II
MYTPVELIIEALANGRFVAVTDDEQREDEADLVIAAEHITVEQMAFLIRHTSGIICVPMRAERLRELGLELLPTTQPTRFGTPFTMPVDFLPTSRGGVSAEERVQTIRALIDPATNPADLGRPGHVFPLQGHPDGLRGRAGHTEAALELVQRAQLYPAAVIGELMDEHGRMMRGKLLHDFLQQHDIPLCRINDIAL